MSEEENPQPVPIRRGIPVALPGQAKPLGKLLRMMMKPRIKQTVRKKRDWDHTIKYY